MEYKQIVPNTPSGDEESPNDLSSPNPCQVINENEDPKKKVFGLDYNNSYFLFSITNISDKYLALELIPADGTLPFSYKIIYNLPILNSIEYIFKDLKTIDECMKRLISLLLKNRITIYREEAKDLFYIILKVTIIDEDKYIPLKLNCTKEVQVCTIRYIYKEITGLREKFNEYKEIKGQTIEEQNNEIKKLKEKNEKYLKIIKLLKNVDDNESKNKLDELSYKLINLEKDLIYQKLKFKCEFIPSHKIIIFPAQNAQKGFNIEFKIKNIGYSFLSTKYDKIYFDRDTKLSSQEIDFENKNDKNIQFNGLFKPNDIVTYNPKFIIKNPKEDQIYNFYINLYSTIHGIISSKSLIIQALINPSNLMGEELLKYLKKNFEIDLSGNNICIFDTEGKKIDIKNISNNDNLPKTTKKYYPIDCEEEEEEDHINKFFGDRKKIKKKKNKHKNGVIYLHKIKDEIKDYLAKNKDIKITENKIKNIIDRLNLEYFASFWLEQKKILDIIIANDGHYKQIAKIIEDML